MNKSSKILLSLVLGGGAGFCLWKYLNKNEGDSSEMGKLNYDSNQYKYYGVKGGDDEILYIIDEVARQYNFGANQNNLSKFLFEICAVESDFGNAIDKTLNSGEGLTQFDKPTYDELRNDAIKNKWIVYNIANTPYNQLRTNPKLQLFMTRYFIYKRIPSAIPADITGRASQWKKYYNTHLGAGTESGYISRAKKWYNKLNYKGV